jgi:hypothetical protein
MKFHLSLALILFSGAWHVAAAQNSATVQNRQVAIQALGLGQHIRVATKTRQFEGRFGGVDTTGLRITLDSAVTAVALADIDRLWVRGRSTKTGGLAGALAGALIGAGVGFFLAGVTCEDSDCAASSRGAAFVIGLGGAGAGALVGAIVGSAIPKWHRRFP